MTQGESKSTKGVVSFSFENELYGLGAQFVAGVDEAGRGCLAGPVVAACVILPKDLQISGVDDSKKLSPKKREELFDVITRDSVSFGIGIVGPEEIDKINILQASLKAMRIAVSLSRISPCHVLVDGNKEIPELQIPQRAIIDGDALSYSIAAASILAKVSRDRLMVEMEKRFPAFKFSLHKGYGTKAHLEELRKFGPTQIHRKTFEPVAKLINRI